MAAQAGADASPMSSDLFDLDLCVLAYQVYGQSLIWPLDPFYEEWSRPGASRRDNVMESIHKACAGQVQLRGPGSTRGWPTNTQLDPILTDYSRVNPTQATIVSDGTSHRLMRAHESMTNALAEIVVCEYQSQREGRPIEPHFSQRVDLGGSAADRIYVFEGGTGAIDGKAHAWSLLGIVLDRTTADGYETHIAFRGSQSGDGHRAAYLGFAHEVGNPDWVTDMEFLKTVADHRISPRGEVTLGLRDSILSSLGSVVHCLEDIAARRGAPPAALHITGHSLGGALAVQLAAALSIGSFRQALPESLRSWPLDTIKVTTFGAPKSGDGAFAEALSERVDARRVWVHGDPIPEFPDNEHVGVPVRLDNGRIGTVNHEPTVTRRALLDELHRQNRFVDESIASHEPWQDFPDLGSALAATTTDGTRVADLFPVHDARDVMLREVVADAIGQASSYKVPWTKPMAERRRRSGRFRALFAESVSSMGELATQASRIRGVQPGSAEGFLRRWYVIREASAQGWSIDDLLDDAEIARLLDTYRRTKMTGLDEKNDVAVASGPEPEQRDISRVKAILAMRRVHRSTVVDSGESDYRRRVPPVSGMPHVVRSCSHYPALNWLPKELMVPKEIPEEGQLRLLYKAKYYGLSKLGFKGYELSPIRKDVPWDPEYPWNSAFHPPEDGWSDPTDDATFVRLRLQGPNPFDLRKTDDGFVLDFEDLFDGLLPRVVAHFDLVDGELRPRDIEVGSYVHRPGDETWDRAKRVVNAADIRVVTFLRHLLEVHFIVGQALALSAYNLPTWHPLRPFMHFFSFGTLQVNDYAYQAFFSSTSYFLASGFITGNSAETLFASRVASFDFDSWNPVRDIARRGLDEIDGHPYVEDALRVWPELTGTVERYLDVLGLDEATVANDAHLDIWYRTLGTLIPNFDTRTEPLDRARLVEVLSCFLYNNVVHEVCGDLTPLLRSDDPDDKAITNLVRFAEAVGEGRLDQPIPAPTMNDVFLMDQASDASRFNVGGNNLLRITPERWIDEPRLAEAVRDLQDRLTSLDRELDERNDAREVRFGRMQPRYWEASISF